MPAASSIDVSAPSFIKTERAAGGRRVYDRQKAAGLTKIDYEQWVHARSPEFKAQFGDWEAAALKQFLEGAPVATVKAGQAPKDRAAKSLREWIKKIFESFGGKAESPELGTVILDDRAARHDMAHFKGEDKNDAYFAVKDIIEKGRVIERGEKGGLQSHYIAAPVKVGKKNMVAVAMIREDTNDHRLYFHWVKSLEELREASKTPPEGHGLTGSSSIQSVSSGAGGVTPSRAPSGSVGYAKETGTRWATAESDISRRAPSSSVESAEATVSSGAIAGDNQRLKQTQPGVNEDLRGLSGNAKAATVAPDPGIKATLEGNESLSGKDTDVKTLLGVTHKIRAALNAKTDGIIGKLDPVTHEPLPSPESGIADVGASNARPRNDAGGGMPSPPDPSPTSGRGEVNAASGNFVAQHLTARQLKEQAATRLFAHVMEEVETAIIEPGLRTRNTTQGFSARGTFKGELARSIFLFKSFPIAMLERHLRRGMNANAVGKSRAAYLSTLFVGTTVLGAMALQVNETLSGRDPRDMKDLRFWGAAMLKGGALGMYGDFLFADQSQHGSSIADALGGPVLGLAEDVSKLTVGNIHQAVKGEDTHAGAEFVRFLKGNIPAQNLWYTKAATDHLIFQQMQEWANPGYNRRVQDRARREFNQEFWWEPGEVTPERLPDFGRAVNE